MGIKDLYFWLEDAYYGFLDHVQKVIPVYSLIDPIDRIIPSFAILLAVLFLVIAGGLFTLFGGLSFPSPNVTLSLSFNDASGSPITGLTVFLDLAEGADPPSGDWAFPLSKETSSSGKVTFSIPSGTYVVRVNSPAYEPLSQSVELKENATKIFSLTPLVTPPKNRTLLIQDSAQNILGIPSSLPISLSFSCQTGTAPLPQTVYSGNVSIEQPSSCTGLSVTITANGFLTKTQVILGDTTVITMQSSADFQPGPDDPPPTPTFGTVEIFSKSSASNPVVGVQVKLYKVPPVGSNILADQTLSDASGFSLFESVSPGKYVVVLSKVGYKQITSSEFNVVAGETVSLTLSLATSSTKNKLFVKILNESNQNVLKGASVTLFVQTVSGKYIQEDKFTSDVNGVVNQALPDFNGNTKLMVSMSGFITQILSNTGIALGDAVNPFPILMEPASPPSSNGSIPNGVIADVKVVDEIGFPVLNADARLYTPDVNGIIVGTIKTNAGGVARFINLPPGTYQATASTSSSDGSSALVTGNKGQIITLQVPLSLGTALVEVTVKTEQKQVVPDANVSIIAYVSGNVQAKSTTNTQGVASLGVLSGQTVFVKVEKAGYLPYYSVPFDILKDNTHKITLEVSLTSSTPSVDMALTSIYQISESGSQSLAQSILSGGHYAFHFSVKTPSSQTGLKGAVRLNGTTLSLQTTDIGQIVGAETTKGALGFYTTYNPKDEFSPSVKVDSGTPAKIVVNELGDVGGSGSYELIVFVKINPFAVSGTDKLRINYQSKSSTQSSALYESTYTIGQNIPAQGDFLYLFFLTQEGSTNKVQVSSAKPVILEQNKNYTLEYLITNVSGLDFPSATATFSASGSITSNPSLVSLPGFANNKSVGGAVTIKSTQTCSSSQSYCSSLLLQLNNVGNGKQPTAYTLQFFTSPEKALTLNASPSFLIPNKDAQVVQVVALDNFNKPVGSSEGVLVKGKLLDNAGNAVGELIPFTESAKGVFLASIPSAPDGSALEITATASEYISGVVTIPVSASSIISLSEDFSCLTIIPSADPFVLPQTAQGNIVITTTNCGEPIKVYAGGNDSNPLINIPITQGGIIVNEGNPLTLGKSASATVKASAPELIGLYPIFFYARFESQAEYSDVKVVDVKVTPNNPSSQCLDLSSYSFDLTDGSDTAVILNNCNPLVQDSFLPSATTSFSGVYAHALPPLLTPQMQSPGAYVHFKWQVQLDYNNTNTPDVNMSDYYYSSLSDGNWTRYQINDGSVFLDTKDKFNGAESVMKIPDAHIIEGKAVLENQDPIQFPHLPPDPKKPKSMLFETTLMVRSTVDIDFICFDADGLSPLTALDGFAVYLDGVLVQDKHDTSCASSSIPAALKNVHLSSGPHSLQIFVQDKKESAYKIWATYKDSVLTKGDWKPLSYKFATIGLRTNAQTDPPLSSSTFTGTHVNGMYNYPPDNPAEDFVIPKDDYRIPKKLATITGPILDILSNKSGIEHLKTAYPRFYSSDPQVRIFLKDSDVYAQFIGFDDPIVDSQKQQHIIIEDTSLVGTDYAIVRLQDYTTSSPGNLLAQVGVLVDASSSVLGEKIPLTTGSGVKAIGKQNGLCEVLMNMEKGLEYYSNASVNFKVFWLNAPIEYTTKGSLPCAGLVSSEILLASNPSDFVMNEDSNEFWARGAEVLAGNPFWKNDTANIMVVITDNKPFGLGTNSPLNVWNESKESGLLTKAVSALNGKGIRGAVLYMTPIESTAIMDVGGKPSNRAIASLEEFVTQTNALGGVPQPGVVEALEFPPFMNALTATTMDVWEQSGNNKAMQRLAQHLYPISSQDIVVKLISNPPNACVGENGELGFTGPSSLPRVQFNWRWNKVDLDMCDRKAGAPADFLYCDGLQFMVSLTKKLQSLRLAYDALSTDPDSSLGAEIPSLSHFDTYLIRDSFNQSMRDDFVKLETVGSFADSPDYFKSEFAGGAWKDYFSSPTHLNFVIEGDPAATQLPSSGLYRVSIFIDPPTNPISFFSGGQPSSTVTVSLDLLSPSSSLPGYSDFYEIPFDGFLGYDSNSQSYKRNGYGTTFTGNNSATLFNLQDTIEHIKTFANAPGFTSLNTYQVNQPPGFIGLNTGNQRGVVVSIDRLANQFTINPALPTPILGEWSTDAGGQGDLYYSIYSKGQQQFISQNTANSPLAKWTPVASLSKQATLGCTTTSCSICLDGGSKPFSNSLVGDANPISGSCSTSGTVGTDAYKSFGFHSLSGLSNKAYLSSILYSDYANGAFNNYSIWLSCNTNTVFPIGKLAVGNQVLQQGTGSKSTDLALNGNPALQQKFRDDSFLVGNMMELIGTPTSTSPDTGWVCITSGGGKTKVYWNADELRAYASLQGTLFSDFSGNSCTATGSPLSPNGVWTLNGLNDQSIGTLSQVQANNLCSLWNNKPAFNYYESSGLPYPIGTKRYLTSSISGPITNDPILHSIQYRNDPQNCGSGPSPNATCGVEPFTFQSYVCNQNDYRIWSNT